MARVMEKLGGGGVPSEDDDDDDEEMEVKEEEVDDDDDLDDDLDDDAAAMKRAMAIARSDDAAAAAAAAAVRVYGGRYFDPAAAATAEGEVVVVGMGCVGVGGGGGGGGRRSRGREEKERTKLRERHRRAITARILAGLRRHGNYNLRVRADINEVIAALAREAGWVVLPDGTTFPSSSSSSSSHSQAARLAGAGEGAPPATAPPLRGVSPAGASFRTLDYRTGRLRGVFTPSPSPSPSPSSSSFLPRCVPIRSPADDLLLSADNKQGIDGRGRVPVPDREYVGTPCIPVYVMLPLGVINMKCEVADPEGLVKHLEELKAINVDGVMVDCWWGIVEAHSPGKYNWDGYKELFRIVSEMKLKLQVVMSFHECGGNVGDDVAIPLPSWVIEIGKSNQDIYFTDREGKRNTECLSWGIDKERVLKGRTALEVYFDYMRSFRVELNQFFENGIISDVEIGLGPCGELRYPSYITKNGWRYPGIGEFQCYDKYLMRSLRKAAEARGHTFWATGPDNAGTYISQPHETEFFADGGSYDSYYGRFFLGWYSQVLVDHADRVLSLAKLAFEGSQIAAKISGVHWWYKTASHAAELTAGFYNPSNRDGYAAIAAVLKKHEVALNFTCVELRTLDHNMDYPDAMADPEGLVWQVLNAAWDAGIPVASENALPCYDRDGYNKILENAKPLDYPDGRHLVAFTYLRLSPTLLERQNFLEFERFVKQMHGEAVLDVLA